MSGRVPEERVARPLLYQRWQTMTFLHWAYEPEVVQRLLPPGLVPDTFAGAAWVGLTPFVLADFRALLLPPLPRYSTFPETNLRTYVRRADGTDGLWFLSLDVARLPVAVAARAFYWVPYHWADMRVDDAGPVRYTSRRLGPGAGDARHQVTVRPDGPLPVDLRSPVVDFLTGRWRAFARIAGRLTVVPVEHQPWPLWSAEL